MQFPVTGIATAKYHVAGQDVLDPANSTPTEYQSNIAHAERIITIDRSLISSTMISDWDEWVNHYDVRGIYASELGQALAQAFDKNCLAVVALAARASATITGLNGGTVIAAGATVATDGAVLASKIFQAVRNLREKDMPMGSEVWCVVRPEHFALLAETTDNINKDYDGRGSFAEGRILKIGGANIVESNNLPNSVIAADSRGVGELGQVYSGTFSDTIAVVFTKDAIGTVKLRDLMVESEKSLRFQSHILLAKYAMGHGILRPERAVEITKA